ncbi:hypothetical protein QBC32DRAFT_223086, partial [Pseudoneurospora amorphoporcata]
GLNERSEVRQCGVQCRKRRDMRARWYGGVTGPSYHPFSGENVSFLPTSYFAQSVGVIFLHRYFLATHIPGFG